MKRLLHRIFGRQSTEPSQPAFPKPPKDTEAMDGYTSLLWLMWAKDPEQHASFRASSTGVGIREWKRKYPEDFTGMVDGASPSELGRSPRRHIVIQGEAFNRRTVRGLRPAMMAKDSELALEFFQGNPGRAFRKWVAKYPEDFVGVTATTELASLHAGMINLDEAN